jgi:hypothetical protein
MFPESFADKWIQKLTVPGDTVLDPFSGRGTTALTALLAGRNAVACDVNEVAFCLTLAKTKPPSLSLLLDRLRELESDFATSRGNNSCVHLGDFFDHCFCPETLDQILYLRRILKWRDDPRDTMIAALALGSLHGDAGASSPYFSNQMPRTISMNPDYSVRFWKERELSPPARDVFQILKRNAEFRYKSEIPKGKRYIFNSDMRELPSKRRTWPKIKCVITSPPYLNVTSFEEDQWLRLWFLGAPPRPSKGRISKDDRHIGIEAYWSFIADMWRSIGAMVDDEAHIIIRIGSRSMDAKKMKQGLVSSAMEAGVGLRLVSSRVTEIRRRQTGSFRPDSSGCKIELDCHFQYM